MCRTVCPVYKVKLKETASPRTKVLLAKKDLFKQDFYECALCKACIEECPAKVDLQLKKIRQKLVKMKRETGPNKRMIRNIRQFGNPFGELKKGEKPNELFCC